MSLKKRLLAMGLAGLLTMSVAVPTYAASTSEDLFGSFLQNFGSLLDEGSKTQNASRMFTLLGEFKGNTEFKAKIEEKIGELPTSEKERLEKFGFGANAADQAETVYTFLRAVLNELPKDIEDEDNIFMRMYDEESLDSSDYSTYKEELTTIGHDLYDTLPTDFRAEIASWTTSSSDQLDIFNTLVQVVLAEIDTDHKFGDAIYHDHRASSSKDYKELNLGLDSTIKSKMETALGNVVNDQVDSTQITEIVSAFYDFMNVMLQAVEDEMGYADDKEMTGNDPINALYDILVTANLVTSTSVNFGQAPSDDDDDDGGTTPTEPDTGDDGQDDTDTPADTDEDDDQEADEDTGVDVDTDYTSEKFGQAIENVTKIADQSADQAKETVNKIAEDMAAELDEEEVDETAAVAIVKVAKEAAKALLDKDDVTADEAQEVVSNMLKNTVKKAVAKDKTGAATDDIEDDAVEMVTKVIEKAGKVKVDTPAEETATQKKLKTDVDTVKQAVAKAKATVESIKRDLTEAGLSQASNRVKPKVVLDLGAQDDEKEVVLDLDKDVVGTLTTEQSDLQVKVGKVTFELPSDLIADSGDEGLQIASDPLSEDEEAVVRSAGTNREGKTVEPVGKIMNLELKKGTSGDKLDVSVRPPRMKFDVAADLVTVPQTQRHLMGMYVLEEDFVTPFWNYVPSRLLGTEIDFTPPHFSKYAVMKATVGFTDITDHWAKTTIEQMAANDIISGRTATSFDPNAQITRAEFATLLVNMLGLKGEVIANFRDIPEDAWYYDEVGIAAMNGLVSGVGDGNFAPNAPITRQDMAVMIGRAYAVKKGRTMKGDAKDFTDMAMVAEYAKKFVDAARYQKLIGGYGDGTFRPMQTATRAEAAQMIKNLWEK